MTWVAGWVSSLGREYRRAFAYCISCIIVNCILASFSLDLKPNQLEAQVPEDRLRSISGRPKAEESLGTFKVATDGDYLLVPMQLGGQEYLFGLDTGSAFSALDVSLRPFVGDRVQPADDRTTTSNESIELFNGPELFLGKMKSRKNSPVGLIDFAPFRELAGQDLRGLLGMDFLRDYIMRVDSDRGTVSFFRSLPTTPGLPVNFSFFWGRPYVAANIAGINEWFLIDTGWSDTLSGKISRDLLTRIVRTPKAKIIGDAWGVSAGGERLQGRIGMVQTFSVGSFTQDNLCFAESDQNVLSVHYWSRYIVTFDFLNGKMYLKKSQRYDESERRELSGMVLARVDGKTIVRRVSPGGPAELAGIQTKDVILKVGERDSQESRIMELRAQFCEDGRTIPIKLLRADKKLDASLVLSTKPSQSNETIIKSAQAQDQVTQSTGQTIPSSKPRRLRLFRR